MPGDKDVRKKLKQKPGADEYELSRYKPAIHTMLEVRLVSFIQLAI